MKLHPLPQRGHRLSIALKVLTLIALIWGVAYPVMLWCLQQAFRMV